jgi:hypothetical protein
MPLFFSKSNYIGVIIGLLSTLLFTLSTPTLPLLYIQSRLSSSSFPSSIDSISNQTNQDDHHQDGQSRSTPFNTPASNLDPESRKTVSGLKATQTLLSPTSLQRSQYYHNDEGDDDGDDGDDDGDEDDKSGDPGGFFAFCTLSTLVGCFFLAVVYSCIAASCRKSRERRDLETNKEALLPKNDQENYGAVIAGLDNGRSIGGKQDQNGGNSSLGYNGNNDTTEKVLIANGSFKLGQNLSLSSDQAAKGVTMENKSSNIFDRDPNNKSRKNGGQNGGKNISDGGTNTIEGGSDFPTSVSSLPVVSNKSTESLR